MTELDALKKRLEEALDYRAEYNSNEYLNEFIQDDVPYLILEVELLTEALEFYYNMTGDNGTAGKALKRGAK